MRVYTTIDNEEYELEDITFSQFLLPDTPVYLEDKRYIVKEVKKILIPSGKKLDAALQIYLE